MDNDILKQIDSIDRKCEIILEQLRMEYLNPTEAIECLKEFYRSLG
jgi:hypothetical protein